jgi:hypothetical protein
MEVIHVIFFSLGTFFGIDNSRMIADSVVVTIDFEQQQIIVKQPQVDVLLLQESDSLLIARQLRAIYPADRSTAHWLPATDDYRWRTIEFSSFPERDSLSVTIELAYTEPEDLTLFGIDHQPEAGTYSIRNIPDWQIESTNGELRGDFWYFRDRATFTMKPVLKLPPNLPIERRSLVSWWEAIKP